MFARQGMLIVVELFSTVLLAHRGSSGAAQGIVLLTQGVVVFPPHGLVAEMVATQNIVLLVVHKGIVFGVHMLVELVSQRTMVLAWTGMLSGMFSGRW